MVSKGAAMVRALAVVTSAALLVLLPQYELGAGVTFARADDDRGSGFNDVLRVVVPADASWHARRQLEITTTCAPGSYYHLDNSTCYLCPEGFACDGSDTQVQCGGGYYALGGFTNCTICPAGSSCASITSAPVACASGEYSPEGDPICHGCNAGYYCPAPHLPTTACPDGSWSAANSTVCNLCAAGHSCTTTTETPCPANRTSFEGSGACSVCPDGHVCPVADQPPVPCPLGTYVIHITGAESCEECPAGYYCPRADDTPLECPVGTTSEPGASACTTCPAGSYCPGATVASITVCPLGLYSTAGATECMICPAGQYCSRTAALACPPGTYSLANSTSCTTCAAGEYCATRTASGTPCPPGSYSLAGALACTQCPAGFACPDQDTDVRVRCNPGWYSVEGASECTECAAGSYCPSIYTDAGNAACASGYFSEAGQDVCHPCRGGYECNAARTAEVECQPGTYSPPAEDDCIACPDDRICPEAAMAYPRECGSVGDYVHNSTRCLTCPSGNYCPRPEEVTLCPENYFSGTGAVACRLCEPGYLCTGTGNMDKRGANAFPGDSTGANNLEPGTGGLDELCPLGSYCNPADTVTPCPAGMYGTKDGGSSLDDACLPCPPGYQCEEGAFFDPGGDPSLDFNIDECQEGHYCPLGSQELTAVPCRSGTYIARLLDTAGGQYNDRESDCLECPSGCVFVVFFLFFSFIHSFIQIHPPSIHCSLIPFVHSICSFQSLIRSFAKQDVCRKVVPRGVKLVRARCGACRTVP